ncbi:hypothetical protein B0H11DRAFT_2264588 [Mycena galericulata]|nr:hypothetical protein B0H11DRAFT_2264588 [Mycena galericulata]
MPPPVPRRVHLQEVMDEDDITRQTGLPLNAPIFVPSHLADDFLMLNTAPAAGVATASSGSIENPAPAASSSRLDTLASQSISGQRAPASRTGRRYKAALPRASLREGSTPNLTHGAQPLDSLANFQYYARDELPESGDPHNTPLQGNVAILPQDVPTLRKYLPPDRAEIQEAMCALFVGTNVVPTRENIARLSPVLISKNRVATLLDFLMSQNPYYRETTLFSQSNLDDLLSPEDTVAGEGVPQATAMRIGVVSLNQAPSVRKQKQKLKSLWKLSDTLLAIAALKITRQ